MRRAFRLGLGKTLAREVDEELAFHLEMRVQKLIADGLAPEAARLEALRQFGDVSSVRDSCVTLDKDRERAMRRRDLLGELRQDLGYAARMLRRNTGFAAVVVLTLALGIGANTAIFTLVDAVLLRTLPVDHPEQLVAIGEPSRVNSLSNSTSPRADIISYPLYTDLRVNNPWLSGMLASGRTGRLDLRAGGTSSELEHPRGRMVSGNYFSVLGVRPMLGRVFDETEDQAIGAAPVVTISYGYWNRRWHRDPRVVGKTVTINGAGFTIIGVTPQGFSGEIAFWNAGCARSARDLTRCRARAD